MAQLDLKNTTLKVIDGDANEIEVRIGTGNLTYNDARTIEYNLDKGKLDTATIREGDEVPLELTFSFVWEYIKGTVFEPTGDSIEDIIKGTGGRTSVASDPCEPYACDVTFLNDPDCGTIEGETYTFPEFRYESLQHDASAGTVECTGKCRTISPTTVRS